MESFLFLLYGAAVIASGVMILTLGRLAVVEAISLRAGTWRSTYFWLATLVVAQAVAISLVFGGRALDWWDGLPIAGTHPAMVASGLTILLAVKTCVIWVGTRHLRRGVSLRWLFASAWVLWAAFAFTITRDGTGQ